GDVTVRVAYSSVNYKDALAATGKGRILRRASVIGGIDFSGTVVSSTDPRFKKGDAVLTTSGEYVGVSHDGGYLPYARVKGDWLKRLGAKEVMLRQSLNLQKIKPLDKATWAGAVDNLGGDVLAWFASTMKENGVIASIGLAASPSLNTTVMPFILRGVRLLGINSGDSANDVRDRVWQRLASDLKPRLLKDMCRTIPFSRSEERRVGKE